MDPAVSHHIGHVIVLMSNQNSIKFPHVGLALGLALVPALCAGPFQQINLYYSNNEYTEHMHVPSTVGDPLS